MHKFDFEYNFKEKKNNTFQKYGENYNQNFPFSNVCVIAVDELDTI